MGGVGGGGSSTPAVQEFEGKPRWFSNYECE